MKQVSVVTVVATLIMLLSFAPVPAQAGFSLGGIVSTINNAVSDIGTAVSVVTNVVVNVVVTIPIQLVGEGISASVEFIKTGSLDPLLNFTSRVSCRLTNITGDPFHDPSCGGGSDTYGNTGPGNRRPTVALTSPANGSLFNAPATLNFAATASDPDGYVTKVQFYPADASGYLAPSATAFILGEDTNGSDGWTMSLAGVPNGSYSFVAMAIDNADGFTVSTPVSVTVTGSGTGNTGGNTGGNNNTGNNGSNGNNGGNNGGNSGGFTLQDCAMWATPSTTPAFSKTTLNWFCTNVSSCSLDGAPASIPSGTASKTVTQDTTFRLSCSGVGGSKEYQVSVKATKSDIQEVKP